MHPKLASLYMLALAEAMALQRGAQPITDDTLSHLAMGGFTMQRLAEALLDDIVEPQPRSDHEIEEQMAGLTLEMVVPASLDSVPASKLFAFRDRYAGERAAFQQHIHAMVSSLDIEGIIDPEALRDHLQAQYEKTIRPQLTDLRRRLRDWRIETVTSLVNLKVTAPAGLSTAIGTWMLPSGRTVLGAGAVALSVWRVWHDHSRARRKTLSESPAYAYFYHLEAGLPPAKLAERIQRMSRRFLPRS